MISMLAGLKVSSWACNYVFRRPEQNAKGGHVTCCVARLIPTWPRSHGLRKQGMEQQYTSSLDKDFVINLLKGRVNKLKVS